MRSIQTLSRRRSWVRNLRVNLVGQLAPCASNLVCAAPMNTSGLGRMCAHQLAQDPAQVVLNPRAAERPPVAEKNRQPASPGRPAEGGGFESPSRWRFFSNARDREIYSGLADRAVAARAAASLAQKRPPSNPGPGRSASSTSLVFNSLEGAASS